MRVVLDTNVFVHCRGGGDAHLMDLESFRGIPILTVRKFIDLLSA